MAKKEMIEYLIHLLKKNDLSEIEYSNLFSRIKVKRYSIEDKHVGKENIIPQKDVHKIEEESSEITESINEKKHLEEKVKNTYHEIRSPIVGTFYRAPSPDAEVFVNIGERVKKGDTLCIIEAMKMMNEIESDCDGKVVEILVENGDSINEDQLIFYIEP